MSNDFKVLMKKARAAGWKVEHTRGHHLRWKSPDGKHITHTSGTPSDHRAIHNVQADLRKGGLDC